MLNHKKANLFFLGMMLFAIISSTIIAQMGLSIQLSLLANQYSFFIPIIIFFIITRQNPIETMRFKNPGILNMVLVIPLMIACMALVVFIGSISNILFKNYLMETFNLFGDMGLGQWLFLVAVTPAFCEECIMRGVILGNYKDLSIHKAAVFNGLMFGMLHMNFNQFFYAAILGVVMSYLVYYTNSIFTSMFLHFLINGFSATMNWLAQVFKLFENEQYAVDTEALIQSLPTQAVFAVLGLVFIVLLLRLLKKINENEQVEFKEENTNIAVEAKSYLIDIPLILSMIVFIVANAVIR